MRNKKVLIAGAVVSLITSSFIVGFRVGLKSSEKNTKYAGVLSIAPDENGDDLLYVSLDEHPKNLYGLSNVVFKVNKLA